jgi:geranylgeranyl diphosphate synthase, type II
VADLQPVRSVQSLSEATHARVASLPVLIKAAIEQRLDDALPASSPGPARLVEAMRYGLLAPAKRVRGVLACLTARQFGTDPKCAETMAIAIEMVHAASLIIDDLPCMDDAVLRRGRPAAHRVYGEALCWRPSA